MFYEPLNTGDRLIIFDFVSTRKTKKSYIIIRYNYFFDQKTGES